MSNLPLEELKKVLRYIDSVYILSAQSFLSFMYKNFPSRRRIFVFSLSSVFPQAVSILPFFPLIFILGAFFRPQVV